MRARGEEQRQGTLGINWGMEVRGGSIASCACWINFPLFKVSTIAPFHPSIISFPEVHAEQCCRVQVELWKWLGFTLGQGHKCSP